MTYTKQDQKRESRGRSRLAWVMLVSVAPNWLGCTEPTGRGLDPDLLISNTPPRPRTTGSADTGSASTGSADTGGTSTTGDPTGNPDVNEVLPGLGCGQPLPPEQEPTEPGLRTGYTHFWVPTTGETVAGSMPEFAQERHFSVRVPADYDPDRAYRVVYLGQGCGSDNKSAFQNTYTLYNEGQGGTEQAIYVAVSLPDENLKSSMNGRCYDNRAGEAAIEWEAFQAIHTFVDTNYCVDNNRVYVAGYSTGGWLANMWGCYFAGVDPSRKFAGNYSIRGQAAVTGGLPIVPDCGGPVAAIWIHDQFDMANEIAGNYQARDRVLAVNGCTGSASEPWGEGDDLAQIDCQRYIDCPEEYPVVFCTSTDSGHSDQYARAVPAFTQFFALMDP